MRADRAADLATATGDAPTRQAPTATDRGRLARNAASYLLLVALAVVVLAPLYLMLVRAITPPTAFIGRSVTLFPSDVQWGAFADAWTRADLTSAFTVSFVMTVGIVVAQVITATLAAYAFVFMNFPFKNLLFAIAISGMLLPIEVTLLGNMQFVGRQGWNNSYPGLILPFAASAIGIFLLRQGFAGIPSEIREAARLDGYGHLRFLVRIALPLTRPVVASFVLISTLTAWGQYLWPRVITTDPKRETVQLALVRLANLLPHEGHLGPAGALLAIAPAAVLLILFQRHIVRGLTAGAVKG